MSLNEKISDIKFGQLPTSFGSGGSNNITFCVTEDCNLKCKYCYLVNKNNSKKMSLAVAKKAVDCFLSARDIYDESTVIWDFIGGEPFLEIDLIDKISDYICLRMHETGHPWVDSYMFNFSTNGLNYHTEKVQNYIKKNYKHLSIGMSVDGNKIKHDMQRVYPDGRGSFDDVVKNVPLWLSQFKNSSTKATFSHDDISHLKDSIIALWNLGIKNVNANIVFEDVWGKDDPKIFEEQLKSLADYIIENDIFEKPGYTVRFFDPNTGLPMSPTRNKNKYCGSGKAAAVDCDGNILPCIRFTDFSLNKRKKLVIGNVFEGVFKDKLKPFKHLSIEKLNDDECKNCDVASGCTTCVGLCYDDSPSGSIFKRIKYNCEMHKSNARAIEYFWNKIEDKLDGRKNPRAIKRAIYENGFNSYLIIYTDTRALPHCCYSNENNSVGREIMSNNTIEKALQFAKKSRMQPIFIGDFENIKKYPQMIGKDTFTGSSNEILILRNDEKTEKTSSIITLHVDPQYVKTLFDLVKILFENNKAKRINIVLQGIEKFSMNDVEKYKGQLEKISEYLISSKENLRINVLNGTNRVKQEIDRVDGCGCGTRTLAVMPNGKLYPCPAFYFEDDKLSIGNLDDGLTLEYKGELDIKNSIDCNHCQNFGCKRCIYLNKKMTGEYFISPDIQCLISKIEEDIGTTLRKSLDKKTDISRKKIGET